MSDEIKQLRKRVEQLAKVKEVRQQQQEKLEKQREPAIDEKKTSEGIRKDKKESAEEKIISDELSKAIASAKKEQLLAEYKSFAAIEAYKFADYMQKGQKYMKQGRYYRSAEAYSMALIFKSDDPSANIGKSHALFAAGEYMSSALFLAWALEMGPEYDWFKQNIITATGDRDIIETRIAEIEEILTLREVGELRFLSAYIYQQLGREKRAKEMMDIAYEKLADVPAAAILKKMINP